jgi:hypothetical protein
MEKGLSVRICGKSKAHIGNMANATGISIRKFFEKPNGDWYGYGISHIKYEEEYITEEVLLPKKQIGSHHPLN